MNPILINLAIQELPSIIALFKDIFHRQNPDEPELTDSDVISAYNAAFEISIAKDDTWLAAHPKVVSSSE